jgi:hypothetical protein
MVWIQSIHMVTRNVHVSFCFDENKVILSGMTDKPIEKNIDELKSYEDAWNLTYFLEHPLGDNGEKWVFSWNQWAKKEQFFKLEQYLPFPKSSFQPIHYNPWSTLASWSYIANPSRGTIQTNKVYRNKYHCSHFPDKDISFDVKGEPCVGNWNTFDFESGYWY